MYPQMTSEVVGSADHSLGTTALNRHDDHQTVSTWKITHVRRWPPIRFSALNCGSAEYVTTDSAGNSLPDRGNQCVIKVVTLKKVCFPLPFKDEN